MATPTLGEATRARYLYGIVRTDRRPALEDVVGVGGGPLSFVEEGPLAAVVGDVAREDLVPPEAEPEGAAWLERAVLAHERVLERCLEPGPVLPMRFATTLRADGDLRTLLRERAAEFASVLERLLGRREWGVKALLRAPDKLVRSVQASRSDLAARAAELDDRSPGAAYLARKQLDRELVLAGDDLIDELVDAAHRRLATCATESTITGASQPRPERVYLNAAYLVEELEERAFRETLAELGREHAEVGLEYELTGPWPAYNFVDDELRR
ncbi:MAG TPA: GvpL/GvpF family gas vesicle protein [Gaiellaceae bacterium]|nr:GvpL/GvpF family gas vesicle protein [Gaiellaceae bacterium]